jgi:hypothetical protein
MNTELAKDDDGNVDSVNGYSKEVMRNNMEKNKQKYWHNFSSTADRTRIENAPRSSVQLHHPVHFY